MGIHRCAPLPSTVVAELDVGLIAFDAYRPLVGAEFSLLPRGILGRGGGLAFGLAPTGASAAAVESTAARRRTLAGSIRHPPAVAARTLVLARRVGAVTQAHVPAAATHGCG